MIELEQPTRFDYASLDSDTRAFVQEKTQAIHARLKRTAEDVIAIGHDLIEVQDALKKANDKKQGLFLKWLEANFDLSQRTAFNYMGWAERFGGTKIAEIATTSTVLAELYNSDESIIEMVQTEAISPTIPAIREAKQEYQQAQETPVLPLTWNHVDGVPFTAPLPDCYPANRISPLQT